MIYVVLSLAFLFVMTVAGALGVFLTRKDGKSKIGEFILSFSIGIMIATATFSLLVPAMNIAKGLYNILLVSLGFGGGCFVLLLLDKITVDESKIKSQMKNFMFAMTLHNIPEGITVALAFSVCAMNPGNRSLMIAAITLSIGIGIQNVPESFALAVTIRNAGYSNKRACIYAAATGIVEPLFGIAACLMNRSLKEIMPFLLAYAAGTMLHITVEELIPDIMSAKDKSLPTIGIMSGILCMLIMEML